VLGVDVGVGSVEEWSSVEMLHCDVVEVAVWEGTVVSLLNVCKVCASAQSSVPKPTKAWNAVHGIMISPHRNHTMRGS